jgi:hypothetical protein
VSPRGLAPGTLVVLSLHTPREKYWGLLVQTEPAGIVVRGLDVNAFDDWLQQETKQAETMLGPTTVFFPMGRIERVEVDEAIGPIPGLADVFRAKTGRDPRRALRDPASSRSRPRKKR